MQFIWPLPHSMIPLLGAAVSEPRECWHRQRYLRPNWAWPDFLCVGRSHNSLETLQHDHWVTASIEFADLISQTYVIGTAPLMKPRD